MNTSGRSVFLTSALLSLALALTACGGAPPAPAPPPAATATLTLTPEPPATQVPTVAPTATPTATATATPAPTATEAAPVVQLIPRPITETMDVESIQTVVTLKLEGQDDQGQAVDGGVTIELINNAAKEQRSVVMQGEMLGLIAGPDMEKLGATMLGIYQIGDSAYTVLQTDKAQCENQADLTVFDQISPESLLGNFSSGNLHGVLVDEETINGIPTLHYQLDVEKTRAAARLGGKESALQAAETLSGGDLYVAVDGNYPVKFVATYEGALPQFELQGLATLSFELQELNQGTEVVLPLECQADTGGQPPAELEELEFKPIEDSVKVETLRSVITLDFNGQSTEDNPVKGEMIIDVISNEPEEQRAMVMEGSALLDVMGEDELAGVKPQRIGAYLLDGAAYLLIQGEEGGMNVCLKSSDTSKAPDFSSLSPQGLLSSFAEDQQLVGRFAGEETINGIPARHYVLDAEATNAAAAKSSNRATREAAKVQQLVAGDVWMASDGGYAVKFAADYQGTIQAFDFIGDLRLEFEIFDLNSGIQVTLPKACENAIEQ